MALVIKKPFSSRSSHFEQSISARKRNEVEEGKLIDHYVIQLTRSDCDDDLKP